MDRMEGACCGNGGGGGALTPALGSLFSAGSCMTLEASSDGATSEVSKPEKDMEPDAEVCSEIPGGQGQVQSQIRA